MRTFISVSVVWLLSASFTWAETWQQQLENWLPVAGHRNFIVVADSAYPLQSSPGIQTLATGTEHMQVLEQVLASVSDAPHVQGIIYVDKELAHVNETFAPGIAGYRDSLNRLLKEKNTQRLEHIEIIKKLDKSAELFNVLILKTTLTLPYTSVFIELDAGYWNAEAEADLRRRMSSEN